MEMVLAPLAIPTRRNAPVTLKCTQSPDDRATIFFIGKRRIVGGFKADLLTVVAQVDGKPFKMAFGII